MIEISVGRGWSAIILESIVWASQFPPEWQFRLGRATRLGHGLLLHASSAPLSPHADESTFEMHAEILKSEVSWKKIARIESLYTCECCGRPGRLRIGLQRARIFCAEHAYLVGELHDMDAGYTDPHKDLHTDFGFPPEHGDPAVERQEIIHMWSAGAAQMRDVCDFLQIGRADVYHEPIDRGLGIHLVEGPDDDAAAEKMVTLLGGRTGRTRH